MTVLGPLEAKGSAGRATTKQRDKREGVGHRGGIPPSGVTDLFVKGTKEDERSVRSQRSPLESKNAALNVCRNEKK